MWPPALPPCATLAQAAAQEGYRDRRCRARWSTRRPLRRYASVVKLEAIEVWTLERELVSGLDTAVGTQRRRPIVLVRVLAEGDEGWGECVALREPTYSEEYAAGAIALLLDYLGPRVLGTWGVEGPPSSAVFAVVQAMSVVRGHAMAKAALEMAVLDLALRAEQRCLAQFLGARKQAVLAGATIGLGESEAAIVAAGEAAADAGYRRLKCKIAPGRGLRFVEALRRALPDVALSADANGAFCLERDEDRAELYALDELGLVALEQPLAPDDLVGHARLAGELETPVLLDESVRSLGQLESVAALGACDGVAVKPGPLGGVLVARALVARCVELGLSCAIGGMLETGLGRAASLAVAALDGFDLAGDLGASERYFRPDLTEDHVLSDGLLAVPTSPGIGRVLLPGALCEAQLVGTCRATS
jgi:O-succinylbenzoate synthase